jgi:hypothetical protein
VLKHGPMPPAADEGVNALDFWNAMARGDAEVERGGAGPRGNGSLVAAGTAGSPVLKHGPMPPAAEEGVNALEDVEQLFPIVWRRKSRRCVRAN